MKRIYFFIRDAWRMHMGMLKLRRAFAYINKDVKPETETLNIIRHLYAEIECDWNHRIDRYVWRRDVRE